MSEIIFESLELENFSTIEKASLPLEKRGLLLIQGINEDDPSATSNGSGKSSVPDGLCWTLYGVTARDESGDAVINRFVGKNCLGRVKFRDGTDSYTVTRYRKHKVGKNRLMLEHNGNDITLGTDKLTQDALEKVLGCTLDVFVASIYAGQERMPNLPAMTDKELKLLVEESAGIKVLEAAYEIANKRAGTAEKTEATELAIVGEFERNVSRAELEIVNCELAEDEWRKDQYSRVSTKMTELTQAVRHAKETKATVDSADRPGRAAEVERVKGLLAAAQSPPPAPIPPDMPDQIPTTSGPPKPESPQYPVMMKFDERSIPGRSVEVIEHELGYQLAERSKLAHDLKHLSATVGTPCGECGKEYAAGDLDGRKASIVKLGKAVKVKIDALEGELAAKKSAIEGGKADHLQLEEKNRAECEGIDERYQLACAEHTIESEKLQGEYERLNAARTAEIERLREAHRVAVAAHAAQCAALDTSKLVAALSAAQSALDEVGILESQLETRMNVARSRKEQLETLKAEVSPWIHERRLRDAALEEAQQDLGKAREKLGVQSALAKNARDAALVFAPNGVRGEIIDTVTPFLNSRTSEYLSILSDGNVSAEWNTIGETAKGEVRERFHIAVSNKFGAESFKGQSGGEKRKVRLATAMALQDLVASRAYKPISLFLCDEIDDALDEAALERLMAVLQDKAKVRGTVIVISHNSLTDWISNGVVVRKKGGMSTLEEA